ncbi:glycoside hydrolase family 38 C-terminal domain-containing protein [Mucilaginibacter rigui]|nr:glycoside hydrolase family 38 C-terminal domain-containing protein [Mucilaginibacter rigui]
MLSHKNKFLKSTFLAASLMLCGVKAFSQQAYYIDGYHGGVWGHYPDWNTRFILDNLNKHPYWNINLEIEPETWDRTAKVDPTALKELQALIANQTASGRVEYVNPAYAQSYMYNIDGESIIRQFAYGIDKLRGYFPGITFNTYSTEEPCFTSALPQILKSFGFKYASLKNPNTCFGGYTRAFGGELVNWIGPDGTGITTSPRYEVEALSEKSTWQTIAWDNSPRYIKAAIKYGIPHPIGMTLQDAGWKGGPFIGNADTEQQKNKYTTWHNYFANITPKDKRQDWKVTQEDMLVSLVWGSQVTQKLAQRVRVAENKVLGAEKIAVITGVLSKNTNWPKAGFDSAWRTLLLSQHHDCWIVPYNGKQGDTWTDKVVDWTGNTNRISDSISNVSLQKLLSKKGAGQIVTVINTQANKRNETVSVTIPAGLQGKSLSVKDASGKAMTSQVVNDKLLFVASTPSFGYNTYSITETTASIEKGTHVTELADGNFKLESDLYSIIINPKKGGSITSLFAKKLNKEMVDQANKNGFNTLRGNFYNDGGFKASNDDAATVTILENGPIRASLQIKGKIVGTDLTQVITLNKGQQIIDFNLNINWKKDVGVGEDVVKSNYKWTNYKKPFYNDSNKLVTVFPLNLKTQKVYKNAPFDVTESKLKNTFYNSWDSIKTTVILNWVDVTDGEGKFGMAMFTDHTTSYTHGENFPLGLVTQYSGMGLWGRSYFTDGPTNIHYALMPHAGKWNEAGVWSASAQWNEPLIVQVGNSSATVKQQTLVNPQKGLILTSAENSNKDVLLRFFNAEGETDKKKIILNFKYTKAQVVELNGKVSGELKITKLLNGLTSVELPMPKFGIRTIRFSTI